MESYSNEPGAVKSRRQAAAEGTRRAIVAAAGELFLADGYHETSIAAIARRAGVAVQTIYNSAGGKRHLLLAVFDEAASGDRAPVPVPVFMREQAEREPDPRRVVEQLVELWRGLWPRTAGLFAVIRQAAATDPDIAQLERERAARRLANYGSAASLLAERGALRPGLAEDEAAAAIFALGHPELYRTMVLEQGWEPERYATWVERSLKAVLLAD